MRPAVADANAQLHQPPTQLGDLSRSAGRTPRRPVVEIDLDRQSIATEDHLEVSAHAGGGGVAARRERQIETRMIVEDGERLTMPLRGCEMSLEC